MQGATRMLLFHGEALFRPSQMATHFFLVEAGLIPVSYTHLTLPTM